MRLGVRKEQHKSCTPLSTSPRCSGVPCRKGANCARLRAPRAPAPHLQEVVLDAAHRLVLRDGVVRSQRLVADEGGVRVALDVQVPLKAVDVRVPRAHVL